MARLDNLDYEENGVITNYEIVPEIAPLFNTTTAYAAGDTVIKEGHLYRFNTAHAAGAWIGTDADEITVGEELTSHGADITELKADLTDVEKLVRTNQSYEFNNTGYVSNTGTIQTSSSAQRTDYIPLIGVKSIYYLVSLSSAGCGIAFFDNEKRFLSDISVTGGTGAEGSTIVVTDTIRNAATYFMVSNYGSGQKACSIIVNDDTFDARIDSIEARVDSLEEVSLTTNDIESYIGLNKFNQANVVLGKEIYGDGSIQNQSKSAISGFIYVHGATTLFVKNLPTYSDASLSDRYAYFYDEEKQPIGSMPLGISKSDSFKSFVVPSTAYYFNFCIYQRVTGEETLDYSQAMVTFVDVEQYVPYEEYLGELHGYKVPNAIDSDFWGGNLKLVIFGDSITETASMDDDGSNYVEGTRHNWPEFANSYMHWKSFMNYAQTGATYKDQPNGLYRQSLSNQIALAIANSNNDNADIVVVALGTNDGTSNIGSYETAMNKATLQDLDRSILYEAIRYAFWSLRVKYKNAVCFAGLPIQRASGEQPSALLNAITEMAKRYDFIIIDATAKSGIVRENNVVNGEGTDLYDGLHPNTNGQKKMAKLYASEMSAYYIWKETQVVT